MSDIAILTIGFVNQNDRETVDETVVRESFEEKAVVRFLDLDQGYISRFNITDMGLIWASSNTNIPTRNFNSMSELIEILAEINQILETNKSSFKSN